jgi:hypothetical protein
VCDSPLAISNAVRSGVSNEPSVESTRSIGRIFHGCVHSAGERPHLLSRPSPDLFFLRDNFPFGELSRSRYTPLVRQNVRFDSTLPSTRYSGTAGCVSLHTAAFWGRKTLNSTPKGEEQELYRRISMLSRVHGESELTEQHRLRERPAIQRHFGVSSFEGTPSVEFPLTPTRIQRHSGVMSPPIQRHRGVRCPTVATHIGEATEIQRQCGSERLQPFPTESRAT